jgi:hypothetical protein
MQFVRFTLVGAGLLLWASGTAQASNGIHPRTPVLWEPEPACMTVVDRTVDAKLVVPYTIPYEDLRPVDATDEVEDSRRHQFIAFCAGHSPQEPLPVWLSMADVMQAATVDIINVEDLKPEEVLETSPMWKDCFTRITPDAERRLITFAAAKEPVVWDTTGLAAGSYIVAGYTWEPVFNIWSQRPGVVKVIDDPDPSKTGPALAISNKEEIKYSDELLTVVGCVDAMDGSTITGYWALTDDDTLDVLEWMPFAADTPVVGDSFELPFMPPPESVGEQIALKVEIVDPMDRRYTAYMSELASILQGSGGETGDCSDTAMNFITPPGCESSGGSEVTGGVSGSGGPTGTGGATVAGTSQAEDTGATTTPMQGEGGCGCVQGGGGSSAFSWLWLSPWLLWARRRRSQVRPVVS